MAISQHINQKESSMSSNKTDVAEHSAGGKGIFIALIPWIVFRCWWPTRSSSSDRLPRLAPRL